MNRSQKAFAVGACAGDFNTSIPQRATSSSKPREKVLCRWLEKKAEDLGLPSPSLLQPTAHRRSTVVAEYERRLNRYRMISPIRGFAVLSFTQRSKPNYNRDFQVIQ